MSEDISCKDMANAIRFLSIDAIQKAKSGHPGMPMGMADVAAVLWTQHLKFDPKKPDWPDRDRFVLSAGHGSMLLYSLLYLTGFEEATIEEIKNFRQLGSKMAGHPEYGHLAGVEVTTGPLGSGLATAVGMALAERMLNARYGDDLVDHYTWVIAGDGCLMEGVSHEAIDLAGHLRLNKLIVLWDDNEITIDGKTSVATSMNQLERFDAAGWNTIEVDGHDPDQVDAALSAAKESDRPTFIACKTIIGYGAPNKQGTEATHGAPLGEDEVAATREALGWPYPPFEVPEPILQKWREYGARGEPVRKAWEERLEASPKKDAFLADLSGKVSEQTLSALADFRKALAEEKPKLATRQASKKTLEVIAKAQSNLVGGSADLTHSNLTLVEGQKPIVPGDYSGSYIHYGVREFGMGCAMNGIALHKGFINYGGTFLIFSDYMRGAIRLAALQGLPVTYVFTHDSIGLGEDGPTHQPVETIPSLRAMPNLRVIRPADAMETAEAWEVALKSENTPTALCLTRQGVPALRTDTDENKVARGAYVLREPEGGRDVTLLATGSEVSLAVEAAEKLAEKGIAAAVVSMPCWELFEEQPEDYRAAVLGTAPRVAVEAAMPLGWEKWIGENGRFIGMHSFGASAPGPQLYEHFGITVDNVVKAAEELVKGA
ncbi:transketolase [Thermopetrobacter sp. TC1]|uniref:transketolase n=1 Tax=Thermopetrobacter sp. TC1 TaxID=1495045 RepID=UPI000570FDFA|nr:transketolase [Thermopetrobacter sp. TC1]